MTILITKKHIPTGTPARPGYSMTPIGVTIHNTGSSASAYNHMLYMTVNGGFNNPTSYHYVIDDKDCFELIPPTECAWHAGDGAYGTGNRRTIAIEICECGDILKAHNRAAELAGQLLRERGLTAQKNLYQHASWMNKDCPRLLRAGKPYSWAIFAEKVNQAVKAVPAPAKPAAKPKPKPIEAKSEGSLYRLYNPNSGDHLLTLSIREAQNLQDAGWSYEGVAWTAPTDGTPVYRLINPNSGHHHYAFEAERDALMKAGWKSEGTAFRSGGDHPIYRLYNPNSGAHLLTTSGSEHDRLIRAGWRCELTKICY